MTQHVLFVDVDHQRDTGAYPNGDGLRSPREGTSQEEGSFGKLIHLGVFVKRLDQRSPSAQEADEHLFVNDQHVSSKLVSKSVERLLPGAPRIFLQREGWQTSMNNPQWVKGIPAPHIAFIRR